ncbi:MAG TPA: hypothetical protein VHN37_00500 [Actinomycetota bacterium]|nr:hypothetical protein [Actinomycetota bacterium]
MRFTETGTENAMVWNRRAAPFMEVWYATVTHRGRGSGLWVRYTLTSPRDGEPSCALWACYFDRDGKRSFAGRNDYSTDMLAHVPGRDDGAVMRVGDAWMTETHLEGRVTAGDRAMEWSLDVDPASRCYHHLPGPLRRRAAQRFSTVCSPNLDVPFSGTVTVDGEVVEYEGEPGQQSHRWGRRHPQSWAWLHCASWDGPTDAVVEAVTARAARGLPALTFPYMTYRAEDVVFPAWFVHGRVELPAWSFTASHAEWRIVATARLPLDRSVQVRYDDPGGGTRYCANSEVADLTIDVFRSVPFPRRSWRYVETLVSTGGAHFEIGRPEPFPELPVAF